VIHELTCDLCAHGLFLSGPWESPHLASVWDGPAERAVSAVPQVLQFGVWGDYDMTRPDGNIPPSPHWGMIGSDSSIMGGCGVIAQCHTHMLAPGATTGGRLHAQTPSRADQTLGLEIAKWRALNTGSVVLRLRTEW
jgi:hypothetical protein